MTALINKTAAIFSSNSHYRHYTILILIDRTILYTQQATFNIIFILKNSN